MIARNTVRRRFAAFVLVVVIVIGAIWYMQVRRHRADVWAMRSVIDQYTLDKQHAPQTLPELVRAGYVKRGAETDKHFQEVFREAAGPRNAQAVSYPKAVITR
jgi:competence protein ComGC